MPITRQTLRLVARMRAAVARIADDLTRALTAAWVLAWDDLAPLFLAAVNDLITVGDGGWPARGTVLRARRTLIALEQTAIELDRLAAQVRRDIPVAAGEAAWVALNGQEEIISSQLPYGATLPAAVRHRRHFADAVDAIVRRTAEQVHVRAWRLEDAAIEAMKRELVRGVVTGDNPRTAAAAMVKRVEGQFNGGLSRALGLARTEIIDAHRHAAQVAQEAHADVLNGWRWHCDLSVRTCPACLAMHGTMHPLSEPGPHDHVNGRCARVPVTKSWAELGFDIEEPADAFLDAREWFDGLPREDQLKIMGPVRLKLLQDGAIEWADLARRRENPGWRPSYQVTPIQDL